MMVECRAFETKKNRREATFYFFIYYNYMLRVAKGRAGKSAIVNSYQVRAQGREVKGNLYIVEGQVVGAGSERVREEWRMAEGGTCRWVVGGGVSVSWESGKRWEGVHAGMGYLAVVTINDQRTNLPSFYKLNEVVPYFNYNSH